MKSVSSLNLPQRQTLELLSAAIFDREPNRELFAKPEHTDWEAIIQLANQQSVSALIFERTLTLPKDLLPPRQERLSMALALDKVERYNQKHVKKQQELYQHYEAITLMPVLLKGITMAQLYPRPSLRILGDMDVYLPLEQGYEQANQWAAEQGYTLLGDSVYEKAYYYGSTLIENHKYITYFGISRYDRTLSQIMKQIREQNTWFYTSIEGQRYRTLPIELNAVYTFHHILHHFSYLGIGLRQVCDWILLMQRYSASMDRELFLSYAESFDLLRPMRLFALMSIRHLGASADYYPFTIPSDKHARNLADLIIEDIFVGGNFGFEHFKNKRFKNIWQRRWFMFRRTTWRSMRVGEIAPEHIRLIPLIAIWTRLKILFNKQ